MNQSIYAYGYLNNGLVYSKQGKFIKAINEYNKAIEESPEYAAAYHNRANAYQSLAILEEAIKDYVIAIRINPQYSAAYFNRGLVFGKQGKFEEAIVDYTQFIQMVPENASAYNNRANAYQNLGNFNEAIADYSKSIEINPQYAIQSFGNAYVNYGKFDDAIIDCSKAIQLHNENADAYYIRANAYKNQGKHEEAIADYSKALEINSKHAAAYYNRGLVYSDQEMFEKAIIDYSKAIEILPANPLYYFSLGFLYFSRKQFNQAYQNFQNAIQCQLIVTPLQKFQFQLSKDKMIFLQLKVEILTSIDKELQNTYGEMEYLLKSNIISEIQQSQYQSEINNIENLIQQFVPSKSIENQEEILQELKLLKEQISSIKTEICKFNRNTNNDLQDQTQILNQINPLTQIENSRINSEFPKYREGLNPKMNLYYRSLFWHLFNYLYIIDLISSDCTLINFELDQEKMLEIIQKIEKFKNSDEGFVPINSQTFDLINTALDLAGNIQQKRLQSRVFNIKQILQFFAICTSEYKRDIEQASIFLVNNIQYTYQKNQFNKFELFVEKISILEIDYEEYSESNFWKTGILHTLIILKYLEENYQYIINSSSVFAFKDIIIRSINDFNPESLEIEYIKQK